MLKDYYGAVLKGQRSYKCLYKTLASGNTINHPFVYEYAKTAAGWNLLNDITIPKTQKLVFKGEKMSNRKDLLNYMTCLLVDTADALSMWLFDNDIKEKSKIIWINEGDTFKVRDNLLNLIQNSGIFGGKLFVYDGESNVRVVISVVSNGGAGELAINGDETYVDNVIKCVTESSLCLIPPKIQRVTVSNGNLMKKSFSLCETKDFDSKLFYPYLDESPEEIADRFKESGANILLLIGSPGTGKSNFLRRIMDHYGYENQPYIVDNEDILLDPNMVTFLQSQDDMELFVAEDADNFVSKRSDNNRSMVGLLNMSSGVAQSSGKVILSTNLSNISKVDEALLRPGRCFRVIEFQKLTQEQAQEVSNVYGDGREVLESLTLAEAINGSNGKKEVKAGISFGFGE